MKYRKKPIVIEAVQWNHNDREMFDFLEKTNPNESISTNGENFYIDHNKIEGGLIIKTLEGEHIASLGDFIIKGISGEFYPCKPDIFEKTYEPINWKENMKYLLLMLLVGCGAEVEYPPRITYKSQKDESGECFYLIEMVGSNPNIIAPCSLYNVGSVLK